MQTPFTVAVPLTDLTCRRHSQYVTWNAEAEIAFQKLKDLLMETPVPGVADPSRSYVLQIDASERGLGAIFSQADHQGDKHLSLMQAKSYCPGRQSIQPLIKNVWPSCGLSSGFMSNFMAGHCDPD